MVRDLYAVGIGDGVTAVYSSAEGYSVHVIPTGVDSLAVLVSRLAPMFRRHGEGVVLLDAAGAATLGLPVDAPSSSTSADHPVLAPARAAGWTVSKLAAWSTFWCSGRPSVHVGVLPWMTSNVGPLLGPDVLDMTALCGRYAELTGGPYHATPGVSGLGLLRDRLAPAGRTPFWQPQFSKVSVNAIRNGEADILWVAPDAAPDGTVSHRYDANMAYLAAAALAEVAPDGLERGTLHFDKKQAGYWLIERPAWNEPRIPSPLGRRASTRAKADTLWVTTPTMVLLASLADDGYIKEPRVLESFTAPGKRLLRRWAEQLVNAAYLTRGVSGDSDLVHEPEWDPTVNQAIKATYREAIGLMGREHMRVYRPDWRHTVIALARCNLWRKIWRVGLTESRWPTAVNVDSVTYWSADPDPVTACPSGLTLGTHLGQFKIETDDGGSA